MKTPADTMEMPFDEAQAREVAKKASRLMSSWAEVLAAHDDDDGLPPQEHLTLVLQVRAPKDNFSLVMEDCWGRVAVLNDSMGLDPIPSDASYLDLTTGRIHLRATPNLAMALTQEEDYFQSVALDNGVWR